jgi:ABC-type lipoprotein export system ATPase subunit
MSGARFYKCDLQMQTPVDRFHWRGAERVLPESSAEERGAVAEAYVRRCYEVGLEVIAITEHNLAPADCASLLPELDRAIKTVAAEYGYEIVVFPGFEVEVPIGAGIHVLCLFEPGTSVEVLSEKLTALGLPSGARFEDGRACPVPASSGLSLDRLLKVVQEDTSVPGIVVLAHASAGSGVMDSDKVMQWWSAEVISDGRLLCLELPHSRDHYLDLDRQTLTKSVLQNSDSRYLRQHPIATICSSDCKSIESVEGSANHIGFRHTWLKMGRPSVEGLRQAFLDHESRIRFGVANPDDAFDFPQVTRLEIRGAEFLNDQSIDLSPNLNVIIGGSGTGKSTILNYLRMCLGQGDFIRGVDTRSAYASNLETVGPGTTVAVRATQGGAQFSIASVGKSAGVLTGSEELAGLEASDYFPVRFFGQREIYAIAEDRMAAMALLDDLHAEEIAQIERRCADLAEELSNAAAKAGRLKQLQSELSQVAAQQARSQAAIAALQAASEPLAILAAAEDRARVVESMHRSAGVAAASVHSLLAELASTEPQETPEDLAPLADRHRAAVAALDASIRSALATFIDADAALAATELAQSVRQELSEAEAAVEAVRSQLIDAGIEPDSFSEHRETVARLSLESTALAEKIADAQAAVVDIARTEQELLLQWRGVQDIRISAAQALNRAVPRTQTDEPFVEVTVQRFGNDAQFAALMSGYRGDRRKISDDDWDVLVRAVLERSAITDEAPNQLWVRWIESIEAGALPDGFPDSDIRLQARLVEAFPFIERSHLLSERVEDRARIVLRRQDGTVAGELEGGLSVGQKCTAILALLLALDTTPAVIDQPEDEIDNEFTYREMVPLLRRVKERRQLIVVTHDPNIPVNGDAELIYSLAAVDGRGAVKQIERQDAVGSLDEPHVRAAVEEIMEGSEQAFLRRHAKYGF